MARMTIAELTEKNKDLTNELKFLQEKLKELQDITTEIDEARKQRDELAQTLQSAVQALCTISFLLEHNEARDVEEAITTLCSKWQSLHCSQNQ